MRVEGRSYIDVLTEGSDCAGACFCTYTFDPVFFEEQILPPILGIASDPAETVTRFLEEGRARCREIPVVCLASGERYRGGQRLPYGLGLVSRRTFHPKISWLLFPEESVVAVGSGNLTRHGVGVNSEMFVALRLSYSDPADRAILKGMGEFVAACRELLDRPMQRAADFLDQLGRLCPSLNDGRQNPVLRFLHTEGGVPLLPQIYEAVGAGEVERVSVISPFFEEDGSSLEGSALGELVRRGASASRGSTPRLQLAVPWADNPIEKPDVPPRTVDDLLNRLCCIRRDDGQGGMTVEYWTPRKSTGRTVQYLNRYGKQSVLTAGDAEALVEGQSTWAVDPVTVYAPAGLLSAVSEEGVEPEIFLFPDWRSEDGRVLRRPLHAKCFVFVVRERGAVNTWLFVGSANASRRALIRPGGNVETGFLLKIAGEVALEDISPDVIYCPRDRLRMEDRSYPAQGPNLALMVEAAAYSARSRELRVEWNQSLAAENQIVLLYVQKVLWEGHSPPRQHVFDNFDLALASCELTLRVGGESFAVPITVCDPEALPANPSLGASTFEELVALYGGRLSHEKLASLRERAARGEATDEALTSVFGERFQPLDLFRAWFGIKADLEVESLTVGGLKVLLDGPQGVRTVWHLLLGAAAREAIPPEEAWFYGLELYRTLSAVNIPEGSRFRDEKRSILGDFVGELRAGLTGGPLASADDALTRRLRRFYL